jgi:hypothetical protein
MAEQPVDVPQGETVIWRYMDLAKLLSLFSRQALYFSRRDLLGDPFEGARGSVDGRPAVAAFYREFFEHVLRSPPQISEFSLAEADVRAKVDEVMDEFVRRAGWEIDRIYVSCWHENGYESEALWRLHGRDSERAVAVRTTVDDLRQALRVDGDLEIGRVSYIDYRTQQPAARAPYFFKRISFQHEREIRFVMRTERSRSPPKGVAVPVDVHALVQAIYLTPHASGWYRDLVTDVLDRYGYRGDVAQSDLMNLPHDDAAP